MILHTAQMSVAYCIALVTKKLCAALIGMGAHSVFCRYITALLVFVETALLFGFFFEAFVSFAVLFLRLDLCWYGRSSADQEEIASEEEGFHFQMQMATAMSLSASGEEALVHSRAESELPNFLVLKAIPPNGWCFYDCVREHLHLSNEDAETSISTGSIAALCMSCLALKGEEMAVVIDDSDEVRVQRRENIFSHRQYRKHCATLDDFQVYVLDKLEVVIASKNVLGTLHYADTPEIEAFLRHFQLSMLRVRHISAWSRRDEDIGSLQGQGADGMMQKVTSEAHLRSILERNDVDLQLLHYQYTGCRTHGSTENTFWFCVSVFL